MNYGISGGVFSYHHANKWFSSSSFNFSEGIITSETESRNEGQVVCVDQMKYTETAFICVFISSFVQCFDLYFRHIYVFAKMVYCSF